MFALLDRWADQPTRGACSRPMPPGSTRSAPTAPKPPRRYFAAHAEMWDSIRSLHVAESEVEQAIERALGDRAARPAGRYRHRHRPDDRTVRAARRAGDRHRPLVGNAAAGAGQAGGGGDPVEPAPGRHVRAAARPTAAPTASSSTRCCIMPIRRPRRSPRRRGCSRPAGPCWSSISRRTSARNCATSDAHVRLGFDDEMMAGWFAAAGLDRRPCRASRRRRADRDPVARRQGRRSPAEGGMNALRAASTDHVPLFAETRGDIDVSFEFFPPKTRGDGGDAVGVDRDAGAARIRASSR